MSHFRKMLFALVATASFFGMTGNAQAQTSNPFVCNTSFSPLVVRVEGLRELVGDIVITCSGGNSIGVPGNNATLAFGPDGGNPPAATLAQGVVAAPGIGGIGANQLIANPTVPAVNISVTVSAGRITNRLFSNNLTDALLFIDEPTNPNTYVANRGNQNPCQVYAPPGFVQTNGVCTGLNYYFENGVATGAGIPGTVSGQTGTPLNVFQGQYGIGGGFVPNERTITFVGVPIVQPGTFTNAGNRIYRIKNIRIQVANVFQVNNQVLAFISIQNPPANLVLNNAQGIIGFVQQGLSFDAISGGPYAQCLGFNNSVTAPSAFSTTGALRFTEAYGVSFKRRGTGGPLDAYDPVYNQYFTNSRGQSNPTVNYNTESGFYNTSYPSTNNLNEAGIASNGTRLRARFSAVPAGISVYVSLAPVTGVTFGTSTTIGQGTNAPGSAYAVSGTDANGATALTFAPVSSSSTSSFTGSGSVQGSLAPGFGPAPYNAVGYAYSSPSGMSTSVRYGQVTIGSDGTGTYVWEVLRADDNAIDRMDFLVAIRFAPTTTIVTDITAVDAFVSGNYAPIVAPDPTVLNSSTIPSFVLSPEDRKKIFTIGNCATNLLYPFVSSVTGFNTGMAIANTSKDPFGTANESGVCLVNFYGDAAGGAVDPPQQKTSKAIPAGKVATFNLLFGNADWGITPVAGFQGYIIVQCNFRWAHGFAFISDPSNLQTAHGYLALILDPNGLGGTQLRRNTGAPVAEQLDN